MTQKSLRLIDLVTLAFLLWAPHAEAQTYVRPSKGVPFVALTMDSSTGICANGTVGGGCTSQSYDFSSFEGVQVVLYNASTKGLLTDPWVVTNLPKYVRVDVGLTTISGQLTWTINVQGSPLVGATEEFYALSTGKHNVAVTVGQTNLKLYLTGIAFPSKVSIDQQGSNLCSSTSPDTVVNVMMDGGFIPSTSGQQYIVVTNSAQNTSGNIKCRGDNTQPVMAVGNAGTYLSAGQSKKFPTTNPIRCIGDTIGESTDGGGVWAEVTTCLPL